MTKGAEFQALFQRGKRIDRPAMVVLWHGAEEPTRVGFAVSRQIRGAVSRNRARRRLREAYRATREAAPAGVALVIIGKPAALRKAFAALSHEMRDAVGSIPDARGPA